MRKLVPNRELVDFVLASPSRCNFKFYAYVCVLFRRWQNSRKGTLPFVRPSMMFAVRAETLIEFLSIVELSMEQSQPRVDILTGYARRFKQIFPREFGFVSLRKTVDPSKSDLRGCAVWKFLLFAGCKSRTSSRQLTRFRSVLDPRARSRTRSSLSRLIVSIRVRYRASFDPFTSPVNSLRSIAMERKV